MPKKVKRLYKSKEDILIGGVASGFADYFEMDPTMMRVIFLIILVISSGMAVLPYIALLVIMPEKPQTQKKVASKSKKK